MVSGGTQRVKRQSGREDGGRVGEETVHGRRAKKEKHFVPFSLRLVLLLARLFLCFPLLPVRDIYPGGRDEEEKRGV